MVAAGFSLRSIDERRLKPAATYTLGLSAVVVKTTPDESGNYFYGLKDSNTKAAAA